MQDAEAGKELLEIAAQTLGGIDVLINNAGANRRGLVEQSEPAGLRRALEPTLEKRGRVVKEQYRTRQRVR